MKECIVWSTVLSDYCALSPLFRLVSTQTRDGKGRYIYVQLTTIMISEPTTNPVDSDTEHACQLLPLFLRNVARWAVIGRTKGALAECGRT